MSTPAVSERMPVLFIGHGSPLNALDPTPYAASWQKLAAQLPRPRAILCISAHWETAGTLVTATAMPRTIHDFFGFPPSLYAMTYPAPGDPQLAARIAGLLGLGAAALDRAWGFDHGAWAVLRRIYPEADLPVLQLSLDATRPAAEHYALARALAPLRDEGILVLGSGNMVHNLAAMRPDGAPVWPWAEAFDRQAAELIVAGEHQRLIDYPALGEAARLAVPTNEHYLPLLYVLALQQEGETPVFFAEGLVYGSVSMRSLRFG